MEKSSRWTGTFAILHKHHDGVISRQTMSRLVLPGEILPADVLPVPASSSATLKLGPGLRHVPPSTITPVLAGLLCVDQKKNAIWVEHNNGRYLPQASDVILATVHHSSTDYFSCSITPYTSFALLPHLAFEGATKKTRPQLSSGSLIYARIASAPKHMDPEIVCYNPSTGKSEGMGELKGGMVFDLSLGMCRRLLMARQKDDGGVALLEGIAEKVAFEIAIGRNGLVWVKAGSVKETLLVGKALQEADKGSLGVAEQEKLVRKLLKQL